jgi:hypothetical protein
MRSSINCSVPGTRDVKLHHRPNGHILQRGDAQQCINRILSCTRNEQQEASRNAEVFVKVLHAGASEALVEEASSERTAAMTILWRRYAPLGWMSMKPSITCRVPDVGDMTLHRGPNSPRVMARRCPAKHRSNIFPRQ